MNLKYNLFLIQILRFYGIFAVDCNFESPSLSTSNKEFQKSLKETFASNKEVTGDDATFKICEGELISGGKTNKATKYEYLHSFLTYSFEKVNCQTPQSTYNCYNTLTVICGSSLTPTLSKIPNAGNDSTCSCINNYLIDAKSLCVKDAVIVTPTTSTTPLSVTVATSTTSSLPGNHHTLIGTIFFLLFTGLVLYICGGFVYNRFVLQATGYEQLPHYHFWHQLGNNILNLLGNDQRRYNSTSGIGDYPAGLVATDQSTQAAPQGFQHDTPSLSAPDAQGSQRWPVKDEESADEMLLPM